MIQRRRTRTSAPVLIQDERKEQDSMIVVPVNANPCKILSFW